MMTQSSLQPCPGGNDTSILHGEILSQIYGTYMECLEQVALYGTGAIRFTTSKQDGCLTATLVYHSDLGKATNANHT